jgi:hypothetical protein
MSMSCVIVSIVRFIAFSLTFLTGGGGGGGTGFGSGGGKGRVGSDGGLSMVFFVLTGLLNKSLIFTSFPLTVDRPAYVVNNSGGFPCPAAR